ncbi:hypothetical protein IW262DRAFT_1299934 [Armillaria fumosa]|nr:hypothetical protein IW262DRAFT_1299934 [Armillaria fumosa]
MPRDILLEIFHSVCDIWRQDSLKLPGPLGSSTRLSRLERYMHTSPVSWSRNVLKSPFSKHALRILRAYLERRSDILAASRQKKAKLCSYSFNPAVGGKTCAMSTHNLDIAGEYPGSVSAITHFLRRSGCQLESLSMHMEIFQSELSALISEMLSSEACSATSHLKLVLGAQLVKVANTLTPSSVLLSLHRLVLCMEAENFPGEQTKWLVNMIPSRRDAGLLKTIEVQFGDQYNYHGDEDEDVGEDDDRTLTAFHDVEAGIRALINENLDLRVETWNPAVALGFRLLFWDGEVV